MNNWSEDLEGVHRRIVEEYGSPIQILAGPGTGKTYSMMRRIGRLLAEGESPESILAVTFTRTAARDLKQKLAELQAPGSEVVRASTLHSFCFGLLHADGVFEATRRFPRPLLSFEKDQMVKDIAKEFGGKKIVNELLEAYEAAWARLQIEDPGRPREEADVSFEAAITDWLRYHRAMLIGELVPLTLKFARENPALRIIPRFNQILVDEYQDLNRSDQALVDLLAEDGNLAVIGDDNQSIFGFRYANPEGIRTFPDTHSGTVPFTIEVCRRCPPNIVTMSNNLIAYDSSRIREKPLYSQSDRADAEVYIVQHCDLDSEAESLADFADDYLEKNEGVPAGEILFLTPRRLIGNKIRDALNVRGRNSMSYFYEDQVKNVEAAEGFCLLTLLVRPADRTALRAWLGLRSATGLSGGYLRIRNKAEELEIEPRDLLEKLISGEESIAHTAPVVERYATLQEKIQSIDGLEGLDLVNEILPPGNDDYRDLALMAQSIAVGTPDPGELLDLLTEAITQPVLPGSGEDVIRVMSLHKSKGLTAKVVMIAGCMAGALPMIPESAIDAEIDSQYKEQRRLFYVAITRATDILVISGSAIMTLKDAKSNMVKIDNIRRHGDELMAQTSMSPFIDELGIVAPATISTNEWRKAVGLPITGKRKL